MLWTALVAITFAQGVAAQQKAAFPDSPQGRLAAGFFAAVNGADETALMKFQEANFSEAALKRRSADERLARNRDLREMAGKLTLEEVKSASATQLVVTANGSNAPGLVLTITFSFTTGASPKIDAVQITSN
jgi:hypothetical protein